MNRSTTRPATLLACAALLVPLSLSTAAKAADPCCPPGKGAPKAVRDAAAAKPPARPAAKAEAHDAHDEEGHGHGAKPPAKGAKGAASANPAAKAEAHEEHGEGGHEGHGHGEEETSDLDRPVAELWSARCEHDTETHKCDECRYEVGIVKVPASLFGTGGKGGIVRTALPSARSLSATRSFRGEVVRNEAAASRLVAPLAGTVTRLLVRPGQDVAAGDAVAELDSQEISDAKGELLRKHVAADLARKTAEREKALFARKISAEAEVQEAMGRLAEAEVDAAAARSRLLRLGVPAAELSALDPSAPGGLSGTVTLRAPRSGRVAALHAAQGELLDAGKEVAEISDPSEGKVEAILSEGDAAALSRVSGGYAIPAEVVAGKRVLKGTLEVRTAQVDEKTRSYRARVTVADPAASLRPGTFVSVRVASGKGAKALTVPRTAVMTDEGRSFVFVRKEGEFWIRRPVKTGRRLGDAVEILSGVRPGQEVIADGSFVLKSDVLRAKMGAGCAD